MSINKNFTLIMMLANFSFVLFYISHSWLVQLNLDNTILGSLVITNTGASPITIVNAAKSVMLK